MNDLKNDPLPPYIVYYFYEYENDFLQTLNTQVLPIKPHYINYILYM